MNHLNSLSINIFGQRMHFMKHRKMVRMFFIHMSVFLIQQMIRNCFLRFIYLEDMNWNRFFLVVKAIKNVAVLNVVEMMLLVAAISVALLFLLVCNILIGFKKRRGVDSRKNNTAVMYEVERTHETLENGEEIDARQITLQTRNPENLTASYHPNHIS